MSSKNTAAPTPPMGWNSWDCYGASVNEEQLLGNAAYMAAHLKPFGWEYVVCDIQWYEPQAKSHDYNAFFPLEMDAFSRLQPAPNRFPSAADGRGFRPVADKIHAMGLKFGIHIMRGIPRQAVHQNTPLLGCNQTARDIAHPFSLCPWNTDMYGLNPDAPGARVYYESLFALYASWGAEFVKVDDIANTEYTPHNPYAARREIELIRDAIDACGRPMVLSLSPGPAPIEQAEHLRTHANMWRLTGDFWDGWEQLYRMFDTCHRWSPYVSPGCWPDCDMLPLGLLAVCNNPARQTARPTNFTPEEQRTMLTLWCIFRSPLMLGCELRALDEATLRLITNREVLGLLKNTAGARQLTRTGDTVIWGSSDDEGRAVAAFFNLSCAETHPSLPLARLGSFRTAAVRDLWRGAELGTVSGHVGVTLPPHGAALLRLTPDADSASPLDE